MSHVTPSLIREVSQKATCLHTATEVDDALDTMAQAISRDLHEANPIVLCVMIGGVVPTGMLLTKLDFPLQVDYVHATRYQENFVGDDLLWLVKPKASLKDRSILIVDDILDGGVTLTKIRDYCIGEGASEVKTAVLVEKNTSRDEGAIAKADYTGVIVEDRFVFGYGMDYKRYLRNAPGIYAPALEHEK